MEIVKQLEINGPPKSNPPNLYKAEINNDKRSNSKASKSQVHNKLWYSILNFTTLLGAGEKEHCKPKKYKKSV